MKQLFTDRIIPYVIFSANVMTRGAYFYLLRVPQVGGDTAYYQQLASTNADVPIYFRGFVEILRLFGSNLTGLIIFHILLQGLAGVMLYVIGSKLFNKTVGVLAGLSYALWWELFQWDVYVLTDSLFMFCVIMAVYLFVLYIASKRSILHLAGLLLVLGLSLIIRPTAVPLMGAFALLALHRQKPVIQIGTILIAGVVVATVIAHFIGVTDDGRGIGSFLRKYYDLYLTGSIISNEAGYTWPVAWDPGFTVSNSITWVTIVFWRLVMFWKFTVTEYARGHNMLNSLLFTPLYIFGVAGIITALRRHGDDLRIRLLLFLIVSFWIFHALLEIEREGRYRNPILPFVLLFALYGAYNVWQKLRNQRFRERRDSNSNSFVS